MSVGFGGRESRVHTVGTRGICSLPSVGRQVSPDRDAVMRARDLFNSGKS
jgi:hypothetical protein